MKYVQDSYPNCEKTKYIVIYTISSEVYNLISNKDDEKNNNSNFIENYILYPYSNDAFNEYNVSNEQIQLISFPLVTKKLVTELVKNRIKRSSSLSGKDDNKMIEKIVHLFSINNKADENIKIIISKIDDVVIEKYMMNVNKIGDWIKYKDETVLKSDLNDVVDLLSSNFVNYMKKNLKNCLDENLLKNSGILYREVRPIHLYIYWNEVKGIIEIISGSKFWKSPCATTIHRIIENFS